MLWDAAANKTISQGGALHMGTSTQKYEWNGQTERWTVTALNHLGETIQFSSKHLISTAPLSELSSQIEPPPSTQEHGRQLRYRDFITVALIAKNSDDFPDNWIYIHDPSVKVGRVQNFRSWSPEMVPDPSLTCLGLEYFCFEGDGLWSMDDQELINLAKKEISQIGLIRADLIIDGVVVRQPKAYPVYDDYYRDHVLAIRNEFESKYPTLHMVGRNGMHKYNNQDHAMMTAMLTVQNILAGERKYDIWNVNEDAEYHESGYEGAKNALASERLVPKNLQKS
jgi:protoporphyrinogen oxidase